MKFYKCTYDEYQYIWLKERVETFFVLNKNNNWTIEQYTNHFLELNQNQDRKVVEEIFKKLINKQ